MIKTFALNVLPHVEKATVIIQGTAEAIVVSILCDAKKDGLKIKPINLRGTADEVDAGLEEAVKKIFVENKGFFSNVDEVIEDLKEEADDAKVKSTAKASSKSAPKKEEKVKEVELNKDQKAAVKKAEEAIEKARKQKDPDVVAFVRKQTIDALTKAAVPQAKIDELTTAFDAAGKETSKPAAEETGIFKKDENVSINVDENANEEVAEEKEAEAVDVSETDKPPVKAPKAKKEEPAPAAAAEEDEIF